MDEANRPVVVTGTVMHLDGRVVVVPTEPPRSEGLPRSAELRRLFLAANPGWTPGDPDSADVARREQVARRRPSDPGAPVELHGTDLPADALRVRLDGELVGRSVQVESWRVEPGSSSAWAEPHVGGTDAETAAAIMEAVPDDWPLISFGVSTTAVGRSAVMLEVDHLVPGLMTWFDRQPAGSVQLDVFVADATT